MRDLISKVGAKNFPCFLLLLLIFLLICIVVGLVWGLLRRRKKAI